MLKHLLAFTVGMETISLIAVLIAPSPGLVLIVVIEALISMSLAYLEREKQTDLGDIRVEVAQLKTQVQNLQLSQGMRG